MDRDLSSGKRYPAFDQLGPVVVLPKVKQTHFKSSLIIHKEKTKDMNVK